MKKRISLIILSCLALIFLMPAQAQDARQRTVSTIVQDALALLPAHPSDGAILWRLAVCGAGFGLFQSPNNSILIASAPAYRSGSASGMLATARLVGQTTGAALMALFFHLFPQNSTHVALYVSASLALIGALVSSTRISLALPEALRRKR